jgi:hypothetical protein
MIKDSLKYRNSRLARRLSTLLYIAAKTKLQIHSKKAAAKPNGINTTSNSVTITSYKQ